MEVEGAYLGDVEEVVRDRGKSACGYRSLGTHVDVSEGHIYFWKTHLSSANLSLSSLTFDSVSFEAKVNLKRSYLNFTI